MHFRRRCVFFQRDTFWFIFEDSRIAFRTEKISTFHRREGDVMVSFQRFHLLFRIEKMTNRDDTGAESTCSCYTLNRCVTLVDVIDSFEPSTLCVYLHISFSYHRVEFQENSKKKRYLRAVHIVPFPSLCHRVKVWVIPDNKWSFKKIRKKLISQKRQYCTFLLLMPQSKSVGHT